jgi:hypothetical protein
MIYTNTKLNLTNCSYRKYGKDTIYRKRYTIHFKYYPKYEQWCRCSESYLGYDHSMKSNSGILEYHRTKVM